MAPLAWVMKVGGLAPARLRLILFLSGDSQGETSVEWHSVDLDIEAIAVLVWPRGTDAGENAFLALAVADLVNDVARCFRRGSGVGVRVSHKVSFCFEARDHRGLTAWGPKAGQVRGVSAPG